jgi:isopentenyl phosphate kinase
MRCAWWSKLRCRLAVVKLGGGVITVKSSPKTIDYESLEMAASQLARFRLGGGLLVVVHGGGSFGHVEVARIAREKGHLDSRDSSTVQKSMLELAVAVVEALERRGLHPSLHPPHTLCTGSLVDTCNINIIRRDLAEGLTPVTYGDAIPESGRVGIVSGDDLASWIAVSLKADCLVYVIREPGVLDERGEVVPELASLDQLKVRGAEWEDVTGGIVRKVKMALEASKKVDNVLVVGLEHLLKALEGERVGTRILCGGDMR